MIKLSYPEFFRTFFTAEAVDNVLVVLIVTPEEFRPKYPHHKGRKKYYSPRYSGPISNFFRADIVIVQEKNQYRILKNRCGPHNERAKKGKFDLSKITKLPCLVTYTSHWPKWKYHRLKGLSIEV